MKYNKYLVKAEGVTWAFNNINKAMDFVRTMLTAEGRAGRAGQKGRS